MRARALRGHARGGEQGTPPPIRSVDDAVALRDRWVRVSGRLVSLQSSSSGSFWVDAIVELGDGTRIEAGPTARLRIEPLVGKTVSFIGRVDRDAPVGGRLRVQPAPAVREGHVERCGMDGRSELPDDEEP